MFFDDLINMANQCIYTFTYKKLFSNVSPKMESHFKLHLQTSIRLIGESFVRNILEL